MAEEKVVKKETKSVTRAEFDDLAAKVRRMSDNWKKFADVHIGSGAKDGKMGRTSTWVCSGIVIIGMAVAGLAEPIVHWYNGDATWGTAKFDSDLAGTATLTVDAATVNGALTVGTDITVTAPTGGGTASVATVTLAQPAGKAYQATLTLTDVPIVYTFNGANTNHEGSIKVFDMPEGGTLIQMSVLDGLYLSTTSTTVQATDDGVMAFGTTLAVQPTLTSTEVDIIPAIAMATQTNPVDGFLAASALFDGTGTAKDIFLNGMMASNALASAATGYYSGTLVIDYKIGGDN